MKHEEAEKEITEMFGFVPTFMRSIPSECLADEWQLFKNLQLSDHTHIPNKYKELMGLAISAATHCRFCALFHTETARMFGATDEEIEEAVHLAKLSTGWSTYIHGMQIDYELFRAELRQMLEYVKEQEEKKAAHAAI